MIPASLLPEFIVLTFFPSIWFDLTWVTITTARVIIFTTWNLLVTILAVKQAQQLNWGRSILVTVIAFVPTILLQIVFIR